MKIPLSNWYNYISKLAAISKEASRQMQEYGLAHGHEDGRAIVEYAYALATKYGEAAAALTCEMYDAIATAEKAGVQPAEPAATATYNETAKAVYGTMRNKQNTVGQTVGRLVKQAGADTMLQNAKRDGARFAWIPRGNSCAFCLTLASRGWQKISEKALKNGHAEHIHANCRCQYCIDFDGTTTVDGYDPDALREKYESFPGSPAEKIKAWQEELDAEKKAAEVGGAKKIGLPGQKDSDIVGTGVVGGTRNHNTFLNSDLPNGLPIEGEPNSIADKVDENGKVLQRRIYGPDGMALKDFDTTDHGMPHRHPTGAHKHIFDYSKKNPHGEPLPLTDEELQENNDIIKRGENYHDEG